METQTSAALPNRPPLYHYSDAGGFVGMLTSKSLWFSHIKYMNDSEEWFYALRLFEEVLQEYDNASQINNQYEAVKKNPSFQDYFTFSLTEQKDLLSQWRGYCPNGGFSFCIVDEYLDQMVQENTLVFEPCIYEVEDQKEFIRTRIIGVKPEKLAEQREYDKRTADRGHSSKYDVSRMLHDLSFNMISKFKLLCLLKHPSFREEREWRMIGSIDNNSKLRHRMKLRPSRNMLIPYLDLPIPVKIDAPELLNSNTKIYSRFKIKEVVISPHPHQELAIAACKLVIPEYIGNYVGAITASAIPYVNW